MSPQQLHGENPTHFDDIYALGAVIYELLTGKPPFYGGDVYAQVLHATPPSMRQRRAERGISGKTVIPATWEQAIAASLAKDPGARPPTVRAFLEWLRDGQAVRRCPAETRTVRRHRVADSTSSAQRAHCVPPFRRAEGSAKAWATALVSRSRQSAAQDIQSRRNGREATRNFSLSRVKRIVAMILAGALATGGAFFLRQGTASASNPSGVRLSGSPIESSTTLGKAALQPAQANVSARLEESRFAPPQ